MNQSPREGHEIDVPYPGLGLDARECLPATAVCCLASLESALGSNPPRRLMNYTTQNIDNITTHLPRQQIPLRGQPALLLILCPSNSSLRLSPTVPGHPSSLPRQQQVRQHHACARAPPPRNHRLISLRGNQPTLLPQNCDLRYQPTPS